MAKRKLATDDSPDSLSRLRGQIDRLDREIVERLNARARLASQIGRVKARNGQSVYSPEREEEVLARAVKASHGPLPENCIRAIFREVISGSRAVEQVLRVAFLGPAYSYSHLAAIHRFGQSTELVPVASIASVFEEVNRGQANYGVVPIENSTDGRVADTLDMFTRLPVRICGEVQLRIHHCLLGCSPRSEVTEVYSKPQALSQCRNWLARHLPGARLVEVTSTSTAAQLAKEKPGAAAIASAQAAVHYGIDVMAANIEDQEGNLTRFAVLGTETGRRTGQDKAALMFQIKNCPGSLHDATGVFKRAKLNMTWIESFPVSAAQGGGYLFFVEVEGHESDLRVRRAVEALRKRALRLEVLGSYAKTAPIE
jgi:chorismate mutase/prephenate dehydratase